jgi:hypothetical protein
MDMGLANPILDDGDNLDGGTWDITKGIIIRSFLISKEW